MKRTQHFSIALSLLFLFFIQLAPTHAADRTSVAARRASWCGTWDWGIEVALAKHELNQRRLQRGFHVHSSSTGDLETAALQIGQDGDVAVIRDDGSIVVEENLLDLQNRGMKFVRRGKNGYKFRNLGKAMSTDLGDRLNLGDDDTARINLSGFEITYNGKSYSSLFINSDGNLTFVEADTASTSRDIQRFLYGPPRVAPFFADLDPSAATGDGGVYVRLTDNKIIVTWWNVPEFDRTGGNTFQMSMNPRGNVEVVFGDMAAREGIVGVSPGGGGGLELIDLSEELPIKRKGVSMAERFTNDESLDEAAVAAAFYQNFADDYDQLVMFTDFGHRAAGSAIAYHLTVKNSVRGIGQAVYNGSRFFGSSGRLGGFVNMGGQSQYNSDVNRPTFWQTYSATDIVAHELGHQWLVSATFIDSQGGQNRDLLGRGNAHWSFYFDSDLSFMEGNEIRDDGNGLFTTLQRRATYNPFDRYLMGLIPVGEVPEKFYVRRQVGSSSSDVPANPGETIFGTRVDVSIDQIISSLGTRSPSVADSQKSFRVGFIVLVKSGEQPSQSTIDKVKRITVEIEKLFSKETGRLGSIDTTLVGR